MANKFKLNPNGSEINSIFKSSFAIDNTPQNSGGGPSSITGFYHGANIPVGGWVIYKPDGTQFTANNQTILLDFVGSLSGDTSSENNALSWLVENGYVVLDEDFEYISTDSLVLYVDGSHINSYPKTKDTWFDLSGFQGEGNIIGPNYDSNTKSFTYTGGDKIGYGIDGGNLNINPGETNTLSVCAWINPDNPSDSRAPITRIDRWYFQVYSQDRLASYWYGRNPSGYYYSTQNSIPMNKWSFASVVWSENDVKFYVNGELDSTIDGVLGTGNQNNYIRIGFENSGRQYEGSISNVMVYNKELSPEEVFQNYYSTKDKFFLVFGYDTQDLRSFKGEPTINLFSDPHFDDVANNWDGVTQYTSGGVDGGSFGGENSTWSFYQDININQGSVYTITGFVRMPTNNSNVRVALDNSDLGNVYVDTGGEWTFFEYTTPPATSTRTERIYILDASKNNNEVQADKFQIEEKDHSTPFVIGERTPTESLIDLKKKTTIDLSNVSFSSNGEMFFNGASDRIDLPNTIEVRATEDKSYEAVVRLDTSYNSDGSIFSGKRSTNNNFDISSSRVLRGSEDDNFVTSSPEVLQKGRYYHVSYTFSFDGNSTSTQKLYINGELVSQRIESSYVDAYSNNQSYIGYDDRFSQYFKGEIPSFKLYRKELKQKDIQQSFKNYKRYYNF